MRKFEQRVPVGCTRPGIGAGVAGMLSTGVGGGSRGGNGIKGVAIERSGVTMALG